MAKWPVCTGPVVYKGYDAIKADIAHFKAALKANGVEEGFMTSVAPASGSRPAVSRPSVWIARHRTTPPAASTRAI